MNILSVVKNLNNELFEIAKTLNNQKERNHLDNFDKNNRKTTRQ